MIPIGAVITADIVNSTALGSEAALQLVNRLQEISTDSHARFSPSTGEIASRHIISDPTLAYRLALILRTEAKLFQHQLQNETPETDLKIST